MALNVSQIQFSQVPTNLGAPHQITTQVSRSLGMFGMKKGMGKVGWLTNSITSRCARIFHQQDTARLEAFHGCLQQLDWIGNMHQHKTNPYGIKLGGHVVGEGFSRSV